MAAGPITALHGVHRSLHAAREVELAQYPLHVDFHRAFGYPEIARYFLVARAAGEQQQDFALAGRKLLVGRCRRRRALLRGLLQPGDQLTGHARRDDRFSARGSPHRVRKKLRVDVLQQVAARARLQAMHQVFGAFRHGEHEHVDIRQLFGQHAHRLPPADAGHIQVEQHDVRMQLLRALVALQPVGRFAHHLEIRLARQQGLHAAAEKIVVVDQQYADFGRVGRHDVMPPQPFRRARPAGSVSPSFPRPAATRRRLRRRCAAHARA